MEPANSILSLDLFPFWHDRRTSLDPSTSLRSSIKCKFKPQAGSDFDELAVAASSYLEAYPPHLKHLSDVPSPLHRPINLPFQHHRRKNTNSRAGNDNRHRLHTVAGNKRPWGQLTHPISITVSHQLRISFVLTFHNFLK